MDEQLFNQLAAQGYNRIPVMRAILADLDTPLSAYLKLADGPFSYLFESVQGGEKWGRYSIIGLPCRTRIRVTGNQIELIEEGQTRCIEHSDPLQWIQEYHAWFHIPKLEGLPRFTGGLVGYFGYDTVRYIEAKLRNHPAEPVADTPDIMLLVSEEVVVFDNLRGILHVLIHADPSMPDAWSQAQQRLQNLVDKLRDASLTYPVAEVKSVAKEQDFVSRYQRDAYEAGVQRIKDYILAGDVMQVVLSQSMSVPYTASALDLYRALRSTNPSPYMYFLHMGDFHIVGSSPEILVRLEDGLVTVRPIAGTRPRGKDEAHDQQLEQELLADPKELAEHLMLIDLGRNDAGRIANTGSITLTERMIIERYSHVMHIVSNVTGQLRDGLSAMDVLKACFPAGTVSGAPKIRAMEIIDELEPTKRGVYAGAVGYLGWGGNMDTAIAIRTAVIQNGTLYVQAGAGIVADSDPAREWEETMTKGRAIFRAVAIAQQGFGS